MKNKKLLISIFMFLALLASLVPAKGVFASDADDEFNGETLDAQWAWTNENPGQWSLTGTALRMTTQNEDLFETTVSAPLLLTDVLEGNKYEIITKITMPDASANYHQAGIVLWQDSNNFIQVNVQYYNGLEVEIYREIDNDGVAYYHPSAIVIPPEFVYIRLRRYETVYTGYWSLNGINWFIIGQFRNVSLIPAKMGLTAYHASAAAGVTADFDFFHADILTDPIWDAPEPWGGLWLCTKTEGSNLCDGQVESPFGHGGNWPDGYPNQPGGEFTAARIVCRHNGCSTLRDIYFEASFDVNWSDNTPDARYVNWYIKTGLGGAPNHGELYIPCGVGTSGQCDLALSGIIPASQLEGDPNEFYHVQTSLSLSPTYDHVNWSWSLKLSFAPLDDSNCTEFYLTLDEFEKASIDPTIEFPAEPSDQVQTVVQDLVYRIALSGGPWRDPAEDHYDAAISWDGTTWASLASLIDTAECVDYDPENPELITIYLISESDTLYIRANDTAGAFSDNTVGGTFYYTLALVEQIDPMTCDDQFTYSEEDLIAEGYVSATVGLPGLIEGLTLEVGSWYALKATTSVEGGTHGPWHDGANPSEDRYDLEADYGGFYGVFPSFVVGAEGSEETVECKEGEGDGAIAYFQAAYDSLGIRVNDTGGNFTDNTGEMGWKIYSVTYNGWNDGCESKFSIHEMIKQETVGGMQENGKWVGSSTTFSPDVGNPTANLEPGGWYVIETSDGPWRYPGTGHTTDSYEMALKGRTYDGTSHTDYGWQFTDDWIFAECVAEIDALGHRRVYFQMPADGRLDVYIRVNDTADWATNSGQMAYTLYSAVNGEDIDNDCGYTYGDTPFSFGDVPANLENGVHLSGDKIDGTIYALVISGPAWQEYAGGEDQYDMEFSDDEGATWQPFPAYDQRLCYQDEGEHVETLFIQYVGNTHWRLRVASSTFGDNTGGREYSIYTVGELGADCFADLDLYPIDPFEWIPEKREDGIVVTGQEGMPDASLVVGAVYAIQVLEGPWTDGNGGNHYDAALSSDGGATWYLIQDHPSVTCKMEIDIYGHWKVAFTVATSQLYKIRVNDTAGNFSNNGGSLAYELFTSIDNVGDPGDGWDNWIDDYCSSACEQPEDILDVSGWVSYTGCSITQFLAWCPRHNDMLTAWMQQFEKYEPFATFSAGQTLIATITNEIESYNWSDDEVESVLGSSSDPIATIFGTMDDSSPWWGGPVITFNEGVGHMYDLSCNAVLISYIGPYAGGGVCWVMNIANETGAIFWVQLIGIDFPAFVMVIAYIVHMLKDGTKWLGLT